MNFKINQQNIEIIKTSRKGSIALKVEPNRVALMVPKNMSAETISSFINSEQSWLLAKITSQQQKMPKQLNFKHSSELDSELLLFGKKIIYKENYGLLVNKITYQFNDNTLTLFCKQQRALKNISASIRTIAISFFVQQLDEFIKCTLPSLAKIIQVDPSIISIKNYKSRWGSCCANGQIQFNWRLAMAPKAVIEYVIIHELCHLIHANHSKQYWQIVAIFCPNYKQQKAWLKANGATLMSL